MNDPALLSILTKSGNKNLYPVIDGVPWYFPNLERIQSYWSGKKKEFVNYHKLQAEKIQNELASLPELTTSTRARLEVLKKAHEANSINLDKILAELDLIPNSTFDLEIPSHQTFSLYRKNIFRDWGWSTRENKASLDLLTEVVGLNWTPDRFCVLGSGSGRLAMDVHKEFRLPMSVAVDFNPLLLAVSRRMQAGESLFLYDFPTAPVESADVAKLYELKSELGPLPGFHLLCADITALPFKPNSFQSVLTPWLIDILPFHFQLLAQRVNQCLEVGGDWINFGPLGFSHSVEAYNLSKAEVVEQLTLSGFEVTYEKVAKMRYLSADDEVNSRNETVYLFKAKKNKEVAIEEFHYLPRWLLDTTLAVPLSEEMVKHQQVIRFHADLFHTIDGKLSLDQIAQLFYTHYKIPVESAKAMAVNVLRQFEESQKRR